MDCGRVPRRAGARSDAETLFTSALERPASRAGRCDGVRNLPLLSQNTNYRPLGQRAARPVFGAEPHAPFLVRSRADKNDLLPCRELRRTDLRNRRRLDSPQSERARERSRPDIPGTWQPTRLARRDGRSCPVRPWAGSGVPSRRQTDRVPAMDAPRLASLKTM
jgi:hypothetical protein